ncbi:MAG TPA: peptidylprolyl isomerase [Steroidobacter sp.]|uniref:peptidylprolyl isomerase n=1 Tax=Steroidobacter sp. TaxID=1978227 RepID=UPI002EDA2006
MPTDEENSSTNQRAKTFAEKAVREPLLQFMAIALVLFTANHFIRGDNVELSSERISISEGRVQQIAESYRLLAGRLPSRAELQGLVNDFADEEIAYREAVAMGLDADDTIVRRRMRQKLEFLAEDAEASEEPTDDQLAAWLAAHAAEYQLPERISFRHVMVSTDARGHRAKGDAEALLGRLRAGANPTKLGDPSMLPSALPLTTQKGVATLFGEAFASAVFACAEEGWFGPVSSPLGAHLVVILSREPARDPELADIRGRLRSDWIEARRRQRREQFWVGLRQRYDITVEWPEIYADQRPADLARAGKTSEATDARGQ